MQTLRLKATLVGTEPAVWRTLAFHPETGLEQVNDLLLIVMGWDDENAPVFLTNDGPVTPDDDAYHEASLNEYLVEPGDVISYSLESEDEFLVELELIAPAEAGEYLQLPHVIAGENAAPPEGEGGVEAYNEIQKILADATHPRHAGATKEFSGVFDPRYFNAAELNEEAYELFDGEQDGAEFTFDLDDEGNEVIPPFVNEFDADFGNQDLPFEFEWLERAHGIRLTEDDVRGTPAEVSALRGALTEDDLENPRGYLKRILPLYERYPDEPTIAFDVAALYAITGESGKARRIMKRLESDHADNLEYTVNKLMSLQDEDEFQREVSCLPQPLAITNLPPGTDGRYHVTEFLGFEEVAIRDAVIREDLEGSLQRLDRLVRFGFLHGDVEQSATAIAALQVDKMQQAVRSNAPATSLEKQPELSDRTVAILEASTEEVLEMMREYEERTVETVRREGKKVGRNDPCPCGSGKKYKKCCL